MSTTIDERIVEMQFNNQRFEKNVSTSISTLEKLKSALNLDSASKSLDSIEKGFDKLNLSGVGSAVDTIANRFSTMGVIATTILQDIGHMAFRAGQNILGMIKSMTFGQISSGWDKYADKTTSVQTIMSATGETWKKDADTMVQINELVSQGFDSKKASEYLQVWKNVNSGMISTWQAARNLGITVAEFNEQTKNFGAISGLSYAGSQMDYVNSQMEKLNWFTDETSYNFTDMVSNIGKFTSNNIPLSEAVTSMQGIATWAAKSGQNATTASRVMYNLSQAMGAGSVKLMDWRSVETANMATAEFKQAAIDAAVANGRLRKTVDRTGKAIYRTTSGMEVSVENFAQTLQTGWFDKNTLLTTLNQYGDFTNKLYEFSEASGLTATEILQLIDAEADGSITQKEYEKLMSKTGMTMDEIKSTLSDLGSEENEFGRKAFEASQEAKTFQEAVDSVKEAASTKWMHIFENIFGDYEKAKERWTAFAEFLYDTFITPLEKIEEISEILGEINAVDRLAAGFEKLFAVFKGDGVESFGIFDAIGAGIRAVFPPVDNLRKVFSNLIRRFNIWAKSLQLNNTQLAHLRLAAQGVANVFKYLINTFKNIWDATEPLREALGRLAGSVAGLISRFLRVGNYIDTTGAKTEWLQKISTKLAEIIDKVSSALDGISLHDILDKFDKLAGIISVIKQSFINLWDATEPLRISIAGLVEAIGGLFQKLGEASEGFELTELSGDGLRSICEKIAPVIDKLTEAINNISVEDIKQFFSDISTVVSDVSSAFSGFIEQARQFSVWNLVIKIANGILNAFSHLKEFLSGFSWSKILKGLVIGAGIAFLLYKAYILQWLLRPLQTLNEWLHEIEDVTWALNLKNLTAALRNVAIAIGILALSLLALSYVDYEKAIIGLGLIGSILGVLYVALSKMKFTKFKSILKLSIIAGTLLVLASAFLVFSVSLIVLAGAIALFALVAKMDTAWKGLALMAASIGILVAALFVLSKISIKAIAGAAALLILASALIILSVAIGIFALVAKMKSAWQGVGLMAASLGILVIALVALSKISLKAIIGAAALLVLAAALIVLSVAMAVFAKVAGMDSVWKGLGLMAASLGILVAALLALSFMSPMIVVGAASILILAAALIVLAIAMGAFALIASSDSAWKGLGLMAASLAMLVVALLALSFVAPQVVVAAGALLIAAAACIVLAIAIGVVSLVLPLLGAGLQALAEGVSAGLEALGIGIASFGIGVAALIAEVSAAIALGIENILLSVGIGLGVAISAIGTGIGEGLAAAGAGIGSALQSISLAIGFGLVYISMGITALGAGIGEAVASLGSGIGEGIAAVGQGIGQAISGIATGISIGLMSIGIGISMFGAGIGEALSSIGSGIGEGFSAAGEGIGQAISGIASGISEGFASISEGIVSLGEGIAQAITDISKSISDGLSELGSGISSFGDGTADLITSVLGAVAGGVEEVVASVGKGIADGITAIGDSVGDLGDNLSTLDTGIAGFGDALKSLNGIAWFDIGNGIREIGGALRSLKIGNLSTTVTDATTGIINACTEMSTAIQTALADTYVLIDSGGETVVTNMATGMYNKLASVRSAGSAVGSAALTGMRAGSAGSYKIGQDAAQGFINGFLSKELEAGEAGRKLAKKALEKAKEELDEASPSKAFFKIGNFGTMGFINGLLAMEDSVEDAGVSISRAALSSVVDTMAGISEILEENPEFYPTIRPVLDSKAVESGLSRLGAIGTSSYMDARLNAQQDLSEIQNGSRLLASALANVNSNQEYRELSQFTAKDAEEFIAIGNRIINYLKDGHDLYFDDGAFAGRINRRLGSV